LCGEAKEVGEEKKKKKRKRNSWRTEAVLSDDDALFLSLTNYEYYLL
jgi:hypothetical protein